jgi:hypothetical protein
MAMAMPGDISCRIAPSQLMRLFVSMIVAVRSVGVVNSVPDLFLRRRLAFALLCASSISCPTQH